MAEPESSRPVEHGFTLFNNWEIDVGLKYAAEKHHITLGYSRLREISNDAGKNRLNTPSREKVTPRQAAAEAVKRFERRYRAVTLSHKVFEAYVGAIAKMLSERNPTTRAKRSREAKAVELAEVSYGIQNTPDMDPRTATEIARGLKGHPFEEDLH